MKHGRQCLDGLCYCLVLAPQGSIIIKHFSRKLSHYNPRAAAGRQLETRHFYLQPCRILSRGSTIIQLNNCHLWLDGPIWLCLPQLQWPPPQFAFPSELPETKAVTLLTPAINTSPPLWKMYPSFTTLVRT